MVRTDQIESLLCTILASGGQVFESDFELGPNR